MAARYIILALIIQNSLTETITENEINQIGSREFLITKPDVDDDIIKEFRAPNDWMDAFIGTNTNIFPTSSAALMAHATFSNKSPEEQLEDIKEIANQITQVIQSEMANLLSYAISCTDKEEETDNKLRKKRSVETPMDSSQLVMRLLKHIKSNNEYQNIAIEKMMTAQEIADKYGISFTPDPETLSDLAIAANEQAKEMSEILKDACDGKNITLTKLNPEYNNITNVVKINNTTDNFKECIEQSNSNSSLKNSNFVPLEKVSNNIEYDHPAPSHYNYYYNYPYETQISAPPSQYNNPPVTQRPNFYDFISYNPNLDYSPYCSMEPFSASTIIVPIDDFIHAEPELVAEEYEETVSSKVYIDHDEEPGISTVNHVMSYTISEKSYFRTPQIENLPEQMQYYFYLM